MGIVSQSGKINAYEMLLPEEERLLFKTRKLREEMIDGYIDDNKGLPTNTSGMRVMNEVLNSIDDQTLGLVDRRLKNDENSVMSDLTETVAKIFTDKVKNMKNGPYKEVIIADTYIPDDIVDDETSIEYKELSMEDLDV